MGSGKIFRREFLAGAGALAALPACAPAPAAQADGRAEDPGLRPRLLSGCCAYSFKKVFDAGKLTMEDFIRKAVELGVHGVDITAYWLKSTEPAYLASLRNLAFRNGVGFSGAAIHTVMCQAEPAKRAEETEKIKKWVDATDLLGASHLRVFSGDLPKETGIEQGIQWVAETMKPACDYAAKYGITLGVEDHDSVTSRAEHLMELLRRVDSPFAGINLDITHLFGDTDEERYAQIEACIPRATHVHIREVFDQGKRPIDLDRVWKLLARHGYKGYVSAEYSSESGDPLVEVPKLTEQIKTLCRRYSSA